MEGTRSVEWSFTLADPVEEGQLNLLAHWGFDEALDASESIDSVNGIAAVLESNAKITAESIRGNALDTTAGGARALVAEGAFPEPGQFDQSGYVYVLVEMEGWPRSFLCVFGRIRLVHLLVDAVPRLMCHGEVATYTGTRPVVVEVETPGSTRAGAVTTTRGIISPLSRTKTQSRSSLMVSCSTKARTPTRCRLISISFTSCQVRTEGTGQLG